MDNSFPQIDVMPNQQHSFNHPSPHHKPWYTVRRLLVFAIIFTLSAIVSLGYVYSRPALFKSYATLLTVAQTAIDQHSSEADIQHVAIQRQILTSQDLFDETLMRLNSRQDQNRVLEKTASFNSVTVPELRHMLTVQAVPETNLVELAAIGHQAEILAPLINTWIDVYLEKRLEEIKLTTGLTIDILREELAGLESKILIKRAELENFREVNDITSLGRENVFENKSLARFKGLNKSLNSASEEAVKAKAHLDAVNRSIAEGKVVVPQEDKRDMQMLELHLQKLREQLVELDKKYTRNYLSLNPQLNVLPQQIKELEEEIQKKRNYGKSIVLTDAEQAYDAAQQSLREIKIQLEEHKREATEFSSRFSEQESLLSDLEGLELLQRTTQERLVKIEAKQSEKFPQVKVIERAYFPVEPFSPNYTRDAIIAVVGSIILGLLSVWMVEYLTRKEEQKTTISISGTNLYKDMPSDLISSYQKNNEQIESGSSQPLSHDQSYKLEHDLLRELSVNDIDALLEASDIKAKQLVSLLLSGLNLEEIARINREDFSFNTGSIEIDGDSPRSIPLNSAIKTLFEHIEPCPVWSKGESISLEALQAFLVYATADAGLKGAQAISAESLIHTYILYLVKQGIRLSEIEQVIGNVDSTALSYYSRFSPEKKGVPITEVNLLYPSLTKYVA